MFVGLVFLALLQAAHGQNYKLLKSIPIGGEGGWDYLAIDATARKLYVTHASKIVIVDLAQDKVVGEIADTPGVHGFAIAPELGHGFSSNGAESRVSVVDLKTLKTITKIETGENPDAILFEPTRSEVYAFNGRGKSATVIDAKIDKVVATVPLSGKPEFAAADGLSGRVFCNIEDKNEVAVIDMKTHAVTATWPLAPGEEPTGMAFDAVHHRLFVGCHNKLMTMLDSDTGKVVAKTPIGAGTDACAFDDAQQLAFASCGDGTITIAKEGPNAARAPWRSILPRIAFTHAPRKSRPSQRVRHRWRVNVTGPIMCPAHFICSFTKRRKRALTVNRGWRAEIGDQKSEISQNCRLAVNLAA